ncbi:hypothetical protein [Marinagarivorans algicola]|uniref:hypothetical protein n=1 Tax=Marinagarivorans algicola TaxID=1513270 RepID=UPI0037369FA2
MFNVFVCVVGLDEVFTSLVLLYSPAIIHTLDGASSRMALLLCPQKIFLKQGLFAFKAPAALASR